MAASSPATADLELVSPYVPTLLLEHLTSEPGSRVRTIPGSMLFVDVSGFTKLSERLARKGKEGAEELTDAIGSCFSALLELAYEQGGSLLKFGGDALLLFFDGEEHVQRACRSAFAMRRRLRDVGRIDTSGAGVTLRMSSGVHTGTFHFFLVGGSHRELVVTGPAASHTVEMESTAEAGEIVVSADVAAALPARALGVPKGAGVLLRREPPPTAARPAFDRPPVTSEDVLSCVPVAIREHLLSGLHDAEHRRATIAFLHFDGTDGRIERDGAEAVAAALDELIRDVQVAVDEQAICFLGTDVDHDGGKLILTAGAPSGSGDDEERMLLALHRIVSGERELGLRIGVHRGAVFAGDIGPPYRRTYTVMGDTVNLAARLMAKARTGQVLATPDVVEHSRTGFRTTELEPFMVKGKSKPVRALAVGEPTGARGSMRASEAALLGRGSEMETLRDALGSARRGEGHLVEISGEPGIGKSRLVEELAAEASDLPRYACAGELYEASTPYFALGGLLRSVLGIDVEDAPEVALGRLRRVVAERAPQLEPWVPLLVVPLDIDAPPTPETEDLEEQFRRTRLEEVVIELLSAVLTEPVLVTIDDGHLLDEASSDLLSRLTASVQGLPWLLCVARRDASSGFVAPEGGGVVHLRPGPLDPASAGALVQEASEDAPLPPHQSSVIVQRAGGNPFFLLEMTAAVREAGGVGGLPDSVGAVMAARIDRLPPRHRDLLRRASVLGRSFERSMLAAVLDEGVPGPDDPRWRELNELLVLEGDAVSFGNALVRDAAYDGLPYRLRRDLHARVGESIETIAGEDVEQDAELLSLHFILARRFPSAWRFARIAGDRAQAKFAPSEAARFYRRALEAARALKDLPATGVAEVWEALGDVSDRVGDYLGADAAYRAARPLRSGDPVGEARLLLKRAWIPERAGRYSQAIRLIGRARALLEPVDSQDAAVQGAELAAWQAAVRQAQGRSRDAVRWCRRAIGEADAAGDRNALAHAYFILDWALFDLGRSDEAHYSKLALAIYEELGDLGKQAVVLNNLGGMAYWEGRWDEAVELYERGRDARLRTGDPVNAASGTFNIGEIRSDQGRLDEADAMFRDALRVWRAAGDRPGVAFATSYLGRVASRAGRFDEAAELLAQARASFADIGAEGEVLQTDAFIAERDAFAGEGRDALQIADGALARADAAEGGGAHVPLLHRLRGLALAQRGDHALARAALEESLRSARERNADYEAALTLGSLGHLARAMGQVPDDVWERERREILERLGVIATPEVSLAP